MQDEIKKVMRLVERFINKSITFNELKDLLNILQSFIEISVAYSFDEYIENNIDYFDEGNFYEDAVTLLSALRDVETDEVCKTVLFEGGEGEGDFWEHVIQHVESERFMQCEGYYASYHGFYTDSCEFIEVKAVPTTVIDYQPI